MLGCLQEKLSVLDFVDKSDSGADPVKPLPLEVTPFKLVEEVKDLKQLAAKLQNVDEFAVKFLPCILHKYTLVAFFVITSSFSTWNLWKYIHLMVELLLSMLGKFIQT